MAAHAHAVLTHLAANAVHLAQHIARQIQQGVGRRRGGDAAVAALKQPHLQLCFKLAEAAAGCRGRNMFTRRGAGNRLFFHHGHKQAQRERVQSHRSILLCLNSKADVLYVNFS